MSQASVDRAPVASLASTDGDTWITCCHTTDVQTKLDQFLKVTDLLLEQVQLNSTHLFRADIIHDSAGRLETLAEKEKKCSTGGSIDGRDEEHGMDGGQVEPLFKDYKLDRTILRRLIPRKPQLDQPLEQSCYIYSNARPQDKPEALVCYVPHSSSDSMPWYHPNVKALSYLFTQSTPTTATISVHCLPYSETPQPLPDRLNRIFQSLLKTLIRLLKLPSKTKDQPIIDSQTNILNMPLTASALKDTILPQHIVQNTYTGLKETYASDLIANWVEKTEPSKHVFEDLSIAAFLIELWKTMYLASSFPGFVDIACGNGVLTYILIKEGWRGKGFDARRRKTWDVLEIEELEEKVCIPKPFLDVVDDVEGLSVVDGCFEKGTFIISNHADELTCWTPLLAALSCPESPLPFLAIPCCSHALDGSRRRYTMKDVAVGLGTSEGAANGHSEVGEDGNAKHGDLKALRASKSNTDTSMYACLTRKTAALAQELGIEVELTLMRIPSTRNIGIVGNRKHMAQSPKQDKDALGSGVAALTLNGEVSHPNDKDYTQPIRAIIERECASTGGLQASARTWIEKAKKLQGGQGRGKVNWKSSAPVPKERETNEKDQDSQPL